MKRIALTMLLLLLVGLTLPAAAQSPELMAAYRQYQALHARGEYAAAEVFARKALELGKDEFGPNHQTYATLLNNLAELYRAQGRYEEAEPLYKRSLAIWEKALGPDHPDVATSLNNLAALYGAQGRYGEAEPLYKRSLAIGEKALGPDHPDVANSLHNLAGLYRTQGRLALALETIRRASAIHRSRAVRTGGGRDAGGLSEQRKVRYVFLRHLLATIETSTDDPSVRRAFTDEGFEAGQLANATGAGAAVSRMAARFAAGDDALADLVRERQDAAARWRRLDKALVKAASQPPGKRKKAGEAATRRKLKTIDAKIRRIDAELVDGV